MKNVDIEVNNNILTIKVDITKRFGKSKSGKSTIVASTEGIVTVGDVQVGLNVFVK